MRTGSLLRSLECRTCCNEVPAERPAGVCPTCGGTLLAGYDLDRLDAKGWWRSIATRPTSLWRFRELLPVGESEPIATLGEGGSPILPLRADPAAPGVELAAKDDGLLPTGSFKARGMAVAVSRALELGQTELFVPSAGNAGVALAAYGARAGLKVRIYLPEATPAPLKRAVRAYGAEVREVPGTIRDAGELARRTEAGRGSFDLSTMREPYRVEGKKTMAFEIAAAAGPEGLPDAIVYPTGGGTGIVGMGKGFSELRSLGLIDRLPRLLSVQAEGCAPIVRALCDGSPKATAWADPATIAPGLLVPAPFASERTLEALRASRGSGVTVSDAGIRTAVGTLATRHGLSVSPEAAATYAALPQLLRDGAIRSGERVLLYLTGSGIPYW
jgi:threonine synthase